MFELNKCIRIEIVVFDFVELWSGNFAKCSLFDFGSLSIRMETCQLIENGSPILKSIEMGLLQRADIV